MSYFNQGRKISFRMTGRVRRVQNFRNRTRMRFSLLDFNPRNILTFRLMIKLFLLMHLRINVYRLMKDIRIGIKKELVFIIFSIFVCIIDHHMDVNMNFYANYLRAVMHHINHQFFGNFKLNQHINIYFVFSLYKTFCIRASLYMCHLILKKNRRTLSYYNNSKNRL